MKSFIRWAGSKRQALAHLRPYWHSSYKRYVEPFAGSASLFFDIAPQVAGDINAELINTMRELQRDASLVLECFRRLPHGKTNYYRIREASNRALSPAEQAARFIYLNRHCFNGLYRTNKKGSFNVPDSPPRHGRETSIDEASILAAAAQLRHARLFNSDFAVTLAEARRGDFVYLDPPYVVASRRIFAEYGSNSFRESDLSRLKYSLDQLNRRGAKFVITYADSKEARALFSDWNTSRVWTKRNISGFVGARRGTYELFATNVVL